jgi:hypothetical protein
MAVLQSIQSGNFLDASTWGLVDSSSYLDSRVSETILTTSQTVGTSVFTPGAITVAGVSLQLGGRLSPTSGTMTVRLFNNTAASVVKDVVINVADLPNTNGFANGSYIGWTYFKFDANVTLVAGNSYSIRVFTSVTNQITIFRNATANNWSRALVTSTTQAPAATDTVITSGAYTAAGVNTSVTITMNSNSLATQYGNCYVGSNGIFNYGIASATNYGLRINGDLIIGRGATFTIGTAANPIHQTSTAVLEINCASALQFGILNYGTLETKHATTVLHRALLVADIATGATTMTTDVSTGWKQNDSIVIPSTTRTTTHHERRVLSSNASGTTLTIPAISNPHDGNAAIFIQADLANLTRSIKIRSVNTTFKTRFRQGFQGITTFFDVEFFELGVNSHASGTGTFTGTFNVQQCSFWQVASPGTSTLLSNINTTTYTLSNNVFYNYSEIQGTLNDNNLLIGFAGFAAHFAGTIGNNNVISSCTQAGSQNPPLTGTTGNRFYANGGNGAIYISSNSGASTISNYVFFNNSVAIRYVSNNTTTGTDRTPLEKFENCYFYGNVDNISMLGSGSGLGMNPLRKLWFNNCFFWAGKTGLLTAIGYSALPNDSTHFTNCTFGKRPDGVESLFSTSCIRGGQVGTTLTNCLFFGTPASYGSTTAFSSVNGFNGVTSLKHGGVNNEYRQYQGNGFIQNDNTITYNSLPTIKINPIFATNKTFSNSARVAVKSGETCNVSVSIRKSITSDSFIYNGNQPRLMYAFNPLAGNLAETVAATPINLFQYAQNFDNAYWQKSLCSITPDVNFFSGSQPAPDGTFTADLFTEDNTAGRHRILLANTINVSSGTTYTLSVYAKKIAHDWIQLNPVYDTFFDINNWANFNLATGTIGNTGVGATASITSVGNGWYRLSLQCNVISSGATFFNLLLSTNNTNSGRYPSYTGTTANCFLIWGAQFTLGSTLLPYYDNGQFETLSYTTPAVNHDSVLEFYVDCDGTTGWINIDDLKTTTSNDTRPMNYWSSVGVYAEPDWRRPGGTTTFVS